MRWADLRGASFVGANLTGVDFSDIDMSGADFTGANLTRVNLSRTNRAGAIFSNANMTGVRCEDGRGQIPRNDSGGSEVIWTGIGANPRQALYLTTDTTRKGGVLRL